MVAEAVNREAGVEIVEPDGPAELVTDKGYHSREVVRRLVEVGIRSYVSEPERRHQRWIGQDAEQSAVYANRRRVRGQRGKRLQRQRGEKVERVMAHLYETGRMRRVYLRGHDNIAKRLFIHACGLNLGLLMRSMFGVGTPRGLQTGGFEYFFGPILLHYVWVNESTEIGAAHTRAGRNLTRHCNANSSSRFLPTAVPRF